MSCYPESDRLDACGPRGGFKAAQVRAGVGVKVGALVDGYLMRCFPVSMSSEEKLYKSMACPPVLYLMAT